MLDHSAELRLPTIAVGVRFSLVGAMMPLAGELFVSDIQRPGRSALLDDVARIVNGENRFLPVRTGDAVHLYSKHAIAWLALPTEEEVDELFDNQHRVAVDIGGARITGMLFDSSPADRTRLIDHLNRAQRFLRLWTSDEHYLVNTQHIVKVSEIAE